MFIQVIDFETDKIDEGRAAVEEYRAATQGRRTVKRGILAADRDRPGHYLNLVFFDSYEDAMKNSEMPETQELAGKLAALGGPMTFLNLDVVYDER